MKVLVTGGAGYIGSVTTELLLDEGHEVVVFDSLERGHRQAIDRRAAFLKGDLRHAARIEQVMRDVRPDKVVHFAAYALVGESMAQPEVYYRNNVVGSVNLLDAMVRAGTGSLVFSSTCATYGQPDRIPITEDTPQRPTNPYGETKLAVEKAMAWLREQRGMQTIALRYFNACGATEKFGEDHDPETHIIPLVLRVALGQRPKASIFGDDYETPDGTCVRDYIHIVDLAQAHIQALKASCSGEFNLGNGSGHSVKQVLEAAREVTGHEIPADRMPRRPGDPACLIASADKAARLLGWRPRHADLRSIVQSAWDWHLRHPHGYARTRRA